MRMNFWRSRQLFVIASLGILAGSASAGITIYVDDDATPGGNGLSWNAPYKHVKDALTYASNPNNNVSEIHVAQGNYKADRSASSPNGSGSRTATFQLINGVSLEGGYAGLETGDPDARNITAFESILDGDLLDNDYPPYYFNHGDNSYHVVTGSGTNNTAVMDGFTIQSGYANGTDNQAHGAGMFNQSGNPTVSSCLFYDNRAQTNGGAMMNTFSSSPDVVGCMFLGNSAVAGGAVGNVISSSPAIATCSFLSNYTLPGTNPGGAIVNIGGSNPIIQDCIFSDNVAAKGGALGMVSSCDPILMGCSFVSNSAEMWGGAIFMDVGCDPTFVSCAFADNSADDYGGAIYTSGTDPIMINCTIAANVAGSSGGALYCTGDSSTPSIANSIIWSNTPNAIATTNGAVVTVNQSTVQGGWSGQGSGNISTNPQFINAAGGDFRLASGSPCVNSGVNSFVPPDSTTDADTNPRFVSTVDRGAYEVQPGNPPLVDCNNNGVPDDLDIASRLSSDCNNSGTPDECEAGADVNDNGILDECETGDPGDLCVADVDGDSMVAAADLANLLASWGSGTTSTDLDNDGVVGPADLASMLAAWGACP